MLAAQEDFGRKERWKKEHDAKKKKKVDLKGGKVGGMDTSPSEIKIPFVDQHLQTGSNNMCFVNFQIKLEAIK